MASARSSGGTASAYGPAYRYSVPTSSSVRLRPIGSAARAVANAHRFIEPDLRVLESLELNQHQGELIERVGDIGAVGGERCAANGERALEERNRLRELAARGADEPEIVQGLRGLDVRAADATFLHPNDAPGEAQGGECAAIAVLDAGFDEQILCAEAGVADPGEAGRRGARLASARALRRARTRRHRAPVGSPRRSSPSGRGSCQRRCASPRASQTASASTASASFVRSLHA